jgi:transcriptional regulator with XRE-family HTH domain
MPESFGDRLRQQREKQQITLAAIAERTKIGLPLLDGLERDDVSRWPGGIFRRAFIRSYAQAIGLEPDVVVREFLELYPDPTEVVDVISAIQPQDGTSAASRPRTRLQYLVNSAMRSFPRRRTTVVEEPPSSVAATSPGEPAAPDPQASTSAAMAASPLAESARPRDPDLQEDTPVLPATPPVPPSLDLLSAAHLCTELGCIGDTRDAAPLLKAVARALDAVGLIIWVWDHQATQLRPLLAHGYPDRILARLPRVRRDADNATASAFRSTETCIVSGTEEARGAMVIPLMTSMGCVGVLALELAGGGEQRDSVRALATIFAAQFATWIGVARLADAVNA